jgi:hypothetical protein
MTDETTTTKKAGLSPIEVGAGAGAAVITAFASSYLGTAGTLTGAAVASVLGTVSTSVLRNSAQNSAERLKEKAARLRETRVQQTGVTDVRPVESEDIDPYGTQLFRAPNWIDPEPRPSTAPGYGVGANPAGTRGAGPRGTDPTDRLGTSRIWTEGTRPIRTGPTEDLLGTDPTGDGTLGAGPAGNPTRRFSTGPTGADGTPGAGRPGDPTRGDGTVAFGSGLGGGDRIWAGGDGPLGAGTEPGSAWGSATERLTGTGASGSNGTRVTGPGPDGRIRPGTTGGPSGPGAAGRAGAAGQSSATGRPGGPGSSDGPERAGTGSGAGRWVRPRWVVLGAGAAAAFAVALGAITGIEAVAGKPLSGLAGQGASSGTTLGRVTGSGGGSGSGSTPTPTPTPTTSGDTRSTSTGSPSPGAGATSPTGGDLSATAPAPSATQPTPAPSATQPAPTQAPTGSPNPLTSETP